MNTNQPVFVHEFLEHSALRFPDKTALVFQKDRITYREIDNRANALARKLLELGIKTGDRVLLLLENRPEYVISYYGIIKAGAVAVPVNTDVKPPGLQWLVKDTGAETLISSSAFYRVFHDFNFVDAGIKNIIIFNPKPGQKDFGVAVTTWEDAISSPDGSSA